MKIKLRQRFAGKRWRRGGLSCGANGATGDDGDYSETTNRFFEGAVPVGSGVDCPVDGPGVGAETTDHSRLDERVSFVSDE